MKPTILKKHRWPMNCPKCGSDAIGHRFSGSTMHEILKSVQHYCLHCRYILPPRQYRFSLWETDLFDLPYYYRWNEQWTAFFIYYVLNGITLWIMCMMLSIGVFFPLVLLHVDKNISLTIIYFTLAVFGIIFPIYTLYVNIRDCLKSEAPDEYLPYDDDNPGNPPPDDPSTCPVAPIPPLPTLEDQMKNRSILEIL